MNPNMVNLRKKDDRASSLEVLCVCVRADPSISRGRVMKLKHVLSV